MADGAQHVGHAEFGRGPADGGAASGIERLEPADGRQHHGDAHGPAEERGRAVDLGDVAQHARPEGDGVEGLPVAPQRRLALRAAHQVVPVALLEMQPGGLGDLV